MYVRHGIRLAHLLQNSWRFLVFAWLWSTLIVYLHEFAGFTAIEIPILPVTTIGIAVSLYLGFKSTSSYNRWWEARTIWGAIIIDSRNWANHVCNLIYAEDIEPNALLIRELIDRHLAWVNALAYQLRRSSRHKDSRTTHAFGHRRVFDDKDFHQVAESYRRFLSDEEIGLVEHRANPATHILRRQGDRLRQILRDGYLDSYRQVQMMSIIGNLYASQGKCERIKGTPFPRQIASFGQIFTWFFIILLPFAFVGVFESSSDAFEISHLFSHEYMFSLVPFTVLISWMFFLMEKVSDSTEDPFEGGATDVAVSAICRLIEIDLKEMSDAKDVPEPLAPINGVLY